MGRLDSKRGRVKAYILTRDQTEGGACDGDALAYVNGKGMIQIEIEGQATVLLCGPREARLLAYRLCKAAERVEEDM